MANETNTLKINGVEYPLQDSKAVHSPADADTIKAVGQVRENNGKLEYALNSAPDAWKKIGGGGITRKQIFLATFDSDKSKETSRDIPLAYDEYFNADLTPNLIGLEVTLQDNTYDEPKNMVFIPPIRNRVGRRNVYSRVMINLNYKFDTSNYAQIIIFPSFVRFAVQNLTSSSYSITIDALLLE